MVKRLNALGTHSITTGPCVLYSIIIGQPGASSNVLTVYDGPASDEANAILELNTTFTQPDMLPLRLPIARELNIKLATGSAADVTIHAE